MNKVLQIVLFVLVNTSLLKVDAQSNPADSAKKFDVFVKGDATFINGETDASVAVGGNVILAGGVVLAGHNAGYYPSNTLSSTNYGLVAGGQFVFQSGNQSYVNQGYLRVGNTTGARIFYTDCNNASTNLKVTPYNSNCNTAFNSTPSLALQNQQASPTATNASGLDFNKAFTYFEQKSLNMSKYVPTGNCASLFNFITVGSGSVYITLATNKVNVINLTGAQLNAITQFTFNNSPTAAAPLVINIDQTKDFSWSNCNTAGLNTTDGAYIIFNFYDNTKTITLVNPNTVFGTIFAPDATFLKNNSNNTEGQIICNNFTLNGGEVHYQVFSASLPDCTLSLLVDIDDDNDGILDIVEGNGYDALKDCDNDGIPNYKDATPGCPTPSGNDIYGNPFKPLTWTDCNNDGINDFFDFDRDGIINELDLDSDNDGILDINETRDPKVVDANNDGMVDGVDNDNDGLLSSADANDNDPSIAASIGLTPQDLDRDGTPNYLDLDSDGDGITDYTEATGLVSSTGQTTGPDTDGDGVRSENFGSTGATVADNINGFGARGVTLPDSDGDGIPDPYDIDSDNDGITDNVEGQSTCSYILPTGLDCDGDGVDNAYDICNICTRTSGGITPFDKDGDGIPDYLDPDSDNDGAPDINEGSGKSGNFVTSKTDIDKDGLIDQFDVFNIKTATSNYFYNVVHSNMGTGGSFNGPVTQGSNDPLPQHAIGACPGVDRDWRNISVLPVTITDFKGILNNNVISLSWTSVNEINMNHYELERSTDGQTFITAAEIKATGNSTIIINYSRSDNVAGITSNTVYYRIKQVENSGESKYTNILVFKLSGKDANTLSVFPNPASEYYIVKLKSLKDGTATIRLTDITGKILVTQNTRISAGTNTILFDNISKIAAGTYNLQAIFGTDILNQRVTITK